MAATARQQAGLSSCPKRQPEKIDGMDGPRPVEPADGSPVQPGALSRKAKLIQAVENFNRDLKALILDVESRLENDATVRRTKNRILLALDVDPTLGPEFLGNYLLRFREQILKRDESFFLENSYEAAMAQGTNPERVQLVAVFIPRLKASARALTPDEREDYWDLILDLMRFHAEYLSNKA